MPSSINHICSKEREIGEIEATLKAQSDADARIETNLKELIAGVAKAQIVNTEHYTQITNNFVKITTILEEQKAKAKEAASKQEEIEESVSNLSNKVITIETTVKDNSKAIKAIETENKEQKKKVDRIEKWIVRILAYIAAIITLVEGISNIDSVKVWLFPELKNIPIVEPQEKTK